MAATEPIRGRGAAHNPANRFETIAYDGVDEDPGDEDGAPRVRTQFLRDASKSVIASNDSPDVAFDRSLNPYRGCEHGCAYCYARPSHEYLGFSAGLDFETRIMVKEEAPALLDRELRKPSWTPQLMGISGVTDPYQPAEKRFELTRRCLDVLRNFRNPVTIITKNRLVARDVDLLADMAAYECASVYVSLTTLDLKLNRSLEPRTSSPSQRLETIRTLHDAGVPVGTLVAPIIPGLNDHEVPQILEAASEAGAAFAGYVLLRLPMAVAPLFEAWLDQHYPGRKEKVLNRVRSMRGGELYRSEFNTRMRGEGVHADQIRRLFTVGAQKAGIANKRPPCSTAHFRLPPRDGDQLPLFA